MVPPTLTACRTAVLATRLLNEGLAVCWVRLCLLLRAESLAAIANSLVAPVG